MLRSTRYTLKFITQQKRDLLDKTFDLYGKYLQKTIDLMWDGKVPIGCLTSKGITWMDDLGGQYKKLIYDHASSVNKELDLVPIKELRVENLKNLKKGIKGKFRKSFNDKLQRWTYSQVLGKLGRYCEENRVLFTKVNPAYTSQTCPMCQFKHENNRSGESFKCLNCGYGGHADFVAAYNIARQEFTVPVVRKPIFLGGV